MTREARSAEGSELGTASAAPLLHSRRNNKRIRTIVALLLDLKALGQVLLVILPQDVAALRLLIHVVALAVELILV